MDESTHDEPSRIGSSLEGSDRTIKDAAKWLLAAFAAVFAVLASGLRFFPLTRFHSSHRGRVIESSHAEPSRIGFALEGSDRTIKDAAKWLLAAFAAVFAVLASGLRFFPLTRFDSLGHMSGALICSVVAILTTVWVIFKAAKVLTDLGLTLDDLLARESRALIEARKAGPAREAMEYDPLLKSIDGHRSLTYSQSMSPTLIRDALRDARKARDQRGESAAQADVELLLYVANRAHFSTIFSRLQRVVGAAGIILPISIVGFAVATTQSAASPVVSTPVDTLIVFREGVALASLGLGSSCVANRMDAVVVGGTLSQPLVSTPPSAACNAATFVVTPEVGISVPNLK